MGLRRLLVIGGAEPGEFTAHLRRGVLEIVEGTDPDVGTTLRFADKAAFVDYLTGTGLADLQARDHLELVGSAEVANSFARLLDEPPSADRILVTLHGPAS